jgi:hypothetical protein
MDDSNILGILNEIFRYITDGPWFFTDPFNDLTRVDFDRGNIQTFLKDLLGPVEFIGFGGLSNDAGEKAILNRPFWPIDRNDPYAVHEFYFSKINLPYLS